MRPQTDESSTRGASLQLLGWWHLTRAGHTLHLGGREQRLTALLALRGRGPRVLVAATLWPDTLEDRARASLRTAIKRTQEHAPGLLEADRSAVGLSHDVHVDVDELVGAIHAATAHQRRGPDPLPVLLDSDELLPGWYDDWVLYEREKLHQRRMRALESLATAAYERGDLTTALDTALEACRMEPLLDTRRSMVVRARLALGDVAGAVHDFMLYRRHLAQELGVEPPAELAALLEGAAYPHLARTEVAGVVPGPRRSPGAAAGRSRLDLPGR
jgi:DNA-binding SARP family transcriptional activator